VNRTWFFYILILNRGRYEHFKMCKHHNMPFSPITYFISISVIVFMSLNNIKIHGATVIRSSARSWRLCPNRQTTSWPSVLNCCFGELSNFQHSHVLISNVFVYIIILAELSGEARKNIVIVQFFLGVTRCGSNVFLSLIFIIY